MTAASADPVAQWVALLCEELEFVRDQVSAAGPVLAAQLAALVDVAAAGQADPAWVDELVDLLRRAGLPVALADRGWPFPDPTAAALSTLGDGSPRLDRYGCPRGICGRRVLRQPGGGIPRCSVGSVDLVVLGEER